MVETRGLKRVSILIYKIGVLGAPMAMSLGVFVSFLVSYFYANRLFHKGMAVSDITASACKI